MEKPKSLKWALSHGYEITGIQGTDNVYCDVVLFNPDPPAGYFKAWTLLMASSYMKRCYTALYDEISLPF